MKNIIAIALCAALTACAQSPQWGDPVLGPSGYYKLCAEQPDHVVCQ